MKIEKIEMEQIMVSPALATEFLKANKGNRPVKKSGVERWAASMLRGEWRTTSEGISFSRAGVLLDGQNRLEAVRKSGCTVPMTIFRNVPDEAFPIMNVGISRSHADSTKLPRAYTEVLSYLFGAASGSTMKPTSPQMLALNQHVGPHIEALTMHCNSTVKTASRASVRAAAVVQSMLGNRQYALDIYRRLVLGEVEGLPNIGMAFVKQQLNGTLLPGGASGGLSQGIAFVKAMQVLSPKCRDRKRLLYTDELRAEAFRELGGAMRSAGVSI